MRNVFQFLLLQTTNEEACLCASPAREGEEERRKEGRRAGGRTGREKNESCIEYNAIHDHEQTGLIIYGVVNVVAEGTPHKMDTHGLKATDWRALRKVFSKLVQGMKATVVIDELYVYQLLTMEECTGILELCSKEDSKTLNRRVLMAISRRPPGFAAKLAEILREKHSYLADALEEGE